MVFSVLIRSFRPALLSALWLFVFPLAQQAQSGVRQPYPGRQYITVAGKKMSYESFGLATRRPGSPVLVFEAGFSASGSLFFKNLFPALSKTNAGIGYDRNGEGGSEEDTTLATDEAIIRRQHAFLAALNVPSPYILVGHSLGGPYIRLFTALYPTEVAGLVFVDPPDFMLTDQQNEQIKTMSQDGSGVFEGAIRSWDNTAADTLNGPLTRHRARRMAALFRMGPWREYHSLAPLPDIPVVFLLAYHKPLNSITKTNPAKYNAADQFRLENFTAMIENNHHSAVVVLPGYTHFVTSEDPELVIAAIQRVCRNAMATKKEAK
jgi:pimeloyl-ACP methyl ester carboxylesterase